MWYDTTMKDSKTETTISITTGTIIKAIIILAVVWALWVLRDLALIVITAVILASSIEPGIKFLGKYRVHRIPAVLVTYAGLAGLFFGVAYIFIPPIINEFAEVSQNLPSMIHSVDQSLFGGNSLLTPAFSQTGQATSANSTNPFFEEIIKSVSGIGGATSRGVLGTANIVLGSALSFILIVVLSFYFAMQERGIENFLKIVIPFGNEAYAINLWERSKEKIGKWMQGQLLLGVLIFVLVYLGLTIFGIPYAMLLALLAGLFEIIPVFGPIISAIPGVILAFTTGGASLAIMIAGFYILVQQFESHLIYPLVVRKVVGVPPILVILALLAGAELGGFLGILISVPVAAALMEFVNDIEKQKKTRA